jgi:ADP-heptose:LPS heptosyltransferase
MFAPDILERSALWRIGDVCVRQPLSQPIPAGDAAFVVRKGALRLTMRAARRKIQLRCSSQLPTLSPQIDQAWRRLLWIHEGMPQVGDALMDLAPRTLLAESGVQVDLFCAPHIASLFERDAWFRRTLHRPEEVRPDDYDAAIVLSHDRKSLVLKRERLHRLPWVTLQGYYGGPDFHRARFAAQRLADLMSVTLRPAEFARHSAQKLHVCSDAAMRAASLVPRLGCIALAIGGEWPERTYGQWHGVIRALRSKGFRQFVLLGSGNGRSLADGLLAQSPGDVEVLDLVGHTTLAEAHAVLARAAVAVYADGGLMHLALTTPTAVVALFNASIEPEWRLPMRMYGVALKSSTPRVDDIPPDAVAGAVAKTIHMTPPHLKFVRGGWE